MASRLILLLATSALLHFPQRSSADFAFNFSTPNDLSHLDIGQSAEIDVTLSGASPANPLDFLSLAVQYDPSIFTVTSVSSGPIIVDPGDFDPSGSTSGVVSAFYDDSIDAGPALTTSGIFTSFEVLRIGQSAGSFDFYSVSAQSGSSFPTVREGPALSFAPASSVPEPSSILLLGTAILLVALSLIISGRRQALQRVV